MSGSQTALTFTNIIRVKNTAQNPLDSINVIINDPNKANDHGFVTGGWDGIIRYYTIRPKNIQQIQLAYQKQLQHPIISAAIGRDSIIFAGLATGDIMAIDPNSDSVMQIGSHQAPICRIFWVDQFNILISFGFDNLMRIWSLQNNNNGNFMAKQYILSSKTHCVGYSFPYLLIATIQGKGMFLNLNKMPNLQIPEYNKLFDLIQAGSKVQCIQLIAHKRLYALGCVDGRCALGQFQDGYYGINLTNFDKKLLSKSMKKQSTYSSNTPYYGQVNDIDIGFYNNDHYLILTGTQQASFFNILKKDKPKRIKQKCTAGKLTLDGKYFLCAIGNDWCQGINQFKKNTKSKIIAVRFVTSDLESFIKKP